MQFSSIYAIAQHKNISVKDSFVDSFGILTWSIILTKNLNNWEIDGKMNCLSSIAREFVSVGTKNKPIWSLNRDGQFSIKPLYLHLMNRGGGDNKFPYNIIGK